LVLFDGGSGSQGPLFRHYSARCCWYCRLAFPPPFLTGPCSVDVPVEDCKPPISLLHSLESSFALSGGASYRERGPYGFAPSPSLFIIPCLGFIRGATSHCLRCSVFFVTFSAFAESTRVLGGQSSSPCYTFFRIMKVVPCFALQHPRWRCLSSSVFFCWSPPRAPTLKVLVLFPDTVVFFEAVLGGLLLCVLFLPLLL